MSRQPRITLRTALAAASLVPAVAVAELHDWPSPVHDDPILWMIRADRLEYREGDGAGAWAWEVDGWIGRDLHKLWIKSEGGVAAGAVDDAEVELLYSRAIAAFWDLQLGWRHDVAIDDAPSRDWAAIGVQGLAPYRFEVDAFVYVGEQGRTAARLELEYELPLTQRLYLMPGLGLDFHGKDDPRREIGSGLGTFGVDLRLRYEIAREFAPYLGVRWDRRLGDTADLARAEQESVDAWSWVVGIQAWF